MASLHPPTFLGYIIKRITQRTAWLQDARVDRICSVSTCISPEPESKFSLWRFNAAGCYDTEDLAESTAPAEDIAGWTRLALSLYPFEFVDGATIAAGIGAIVGTGAAALPAGPNPEYRLLGYDAVSGWRGAAGSPDKPGRLFQYHCSPLSCNGESTKYAITPDCLLQTPEEAFAAALTFSREEPEPGPYYVLAVFARDPIVGHVVSTPSPPSPSS